MFPSEEEAFPAQRPFILPVIAICAFVPWVDVAGLVKSTEVAVDDNESVAAVITPR